MRPTRLANILRVWEQATKSEMADGLSWYANAHDDAKTIASTVEIGAGCIAALSPGLRWDNNVEAARRIIDRESLDGLGVRWYDGVRKAEKIRDGRRPDSVLKGNKVRAFYQCIRRPDTRLHVCIDGHAYAIWAGRRIALADTPTLTDKLYYTLSEDYTLAGNAVGVLPHQIQAVTWTVWRRLHDV